jgi:hypothetical protein
MTELPLRIIYQPGGITIQCLCGAESAVVKPAATASAAIIRANRGMSRTNRALSPDGTPAGLLRMALHARSCLVARNRQAEIYRLVTASTAGPDL